MELAVLVDTDRSVRIGEQGFEIVEVAAHLFVDGRDPLGEVAGIPVSSRTSARWGGHASAVMR